MSPKLKMLVGQHEIDIEKFTVNVFISESAIFATASILAFTEGDDLEVVYSKTVSDRFDPKEEEATKITFQALPGQAINALKRELRDDSILLMTEGGDEDNDQSE